jgi:hypothetical protein
MIKNVITLLAMSDWLINDEDIDIAKGKYAVPQNRKDLKTQIKRWL